MRYWWDWWLSWDSVSIHAVASEPQQRISDSQCPVRCSRTRQPRLSPSQRSRPACVNCLRAALPPALLRSRDQAWRFAPHSSITITTSLSCAELNLAACRVRKTGGSFYIPFRMYRCFFFFKDKGHWLVEVWVMLGNRWEIQNVLIFCRSFSC